MRRSLHVTFFALLFSVLFLTEALAQSDPARIAFVNSDRSMILSKRLGGKLDTLFASKGGVKLRNLAVLASTRDGKSLLIAGWAIFLNPLSGVMDSAAAFARIDSPFTNTGTINPLSNPVTFGGAKILKIISTPEQTYTKTLPLGTLNADGTEWWGTWCKAQGGNGREIFFHGNFSGLGPVDSVQITGSTAAGGGYHMSNIALSEDNKAMPTMLTVIFDQIVSNLPRAQLVNWTPGITGGGAPLIVTEFGGLIKAHTNVSIDSSFAFYFRVLPTTEQGIMSAELGLDINDPNKITFHQLRIINAVVNALNPSSRTVNRNALPTGIHFFTGNTGNPGSDFDDKEVVVPTQGFPYGNGGDIMPSFGGDSVVFVTCNKSDVATSAESGIYIYDLNTGTATLIQNDVTKMERQPIFMGGVPKVTPPPPYKVGKAIIDKTAIDFGTQKIGDPDAAITLTLTDTTNSLVKVTSAAITGTDPSNFTVTPASILPATVKGKGTFTFTVKFHPTAAKTYSASLEIHYIDSLAKGEKDSIFLIPITGTGEVKTGGGVHSTVSSFDLSVVPNPFTSSTQITVLAKEAGSTSLEVRDLLGKDIYASKSLMLGTGEKFTYTLDAKALHLAPGTYFVIVRSGSDELTRQVIYIK